MILDNYIKVIQLCKIQPDLCIIRMHIAKEKEYREKKIEETNKRTIWIFNMSLHQDLLYRI